MLSLSNIICSCSGSFAVKLRSSAYSMCVTQTSATPVTAHARPKQCNQHHMMYREKSKGERGHPCLTPRVGRTLACLVPSTSTYSSASYLNDLKEAGRHAIALEVIQKGTPRNGVICLLEVNKCCMQPR